MKLYVSNKLPEGFVARLKTASAQYHVDLIPFAGHVVIHDDDVVVADIQDAWAKCKPAAVLLVVADDLLEGVSRVSAAAPFFIPRSFLQDEVRQAFVVHQIEQVMAAQWMVRSNLQEVHARIQELIDDLQEQVRAVRILFRNALRKSFPRHEHVEASFQYMDQGGSMPIHYLDYFGHPQSKQLWVLGATTQTFCQSADVIDLVQRLSPRPDQEGVEGFLNQWTQRLVQVPSYVVGQVHWTWMCFNFQNAHVVIGCHSPYQGVIWTYTSKGLRPMTYNRGGQIWTQHKLGAQEVLFFIQGLSVQDSKHLESIDRMYAALNLPCATALSHLHDQLLQYCHEHQAMPSGGPSMLFRLRSNVFRVIESQE